MPCGGDGPQCDAVGGAVLISSLSAVQCCMMSPCRLRSYLDGPVHAVLIAVGGAKKIPFLLWPGGR